MAAQQNQPEYDQGRVLLTNGYFRRHFIIVGVEQIVHFRRDVTKRKVGECGMDVQYQISGGIASSSESAALASPSLPSDSKALRSVFDIFATRARGSCGVDPGPV